MITQWAFIGILTLFVLFLVLRFSKSLVRWTLGLGIVGVVLALAWALLAQAQASKRMASAVTVASVGQTASTIATTLLAGVLLLVLVAGGGVIFYLTRRVRWLEYQIRDSRPNPTVKRGPMEYGPARERSSSGDGVLLHDLVQLETLRLLQDMRLAQHLNGGSPSPFAPTYALNDPALEETDWAESTSLADWESPDEDNDVFWG